MDSKHIEEVKGTLVHAPATKTQYIVVGMYSDGPPWYPTGTQFYDTPEQAIQASSTYTGVTNKKLVAIELPTLQLERNNGQ